MSLRASEMSGYDSTNLWVRDRSKGGRNPTAPHRFAGLGVSAFGLDLSLGSGLQTPNTNTKPVHRWNRCVTGHWANSRECRISAPSTSLLSRGEVPVLVVPQELRSPSLSPDSELLVLVTRARYPLFDSHVGHTLFPAWADTHTRTATCRALDYIGFTTDAPTLIYTPLSRKTIRNPPL